MEKNLRFFNGHAKSIKMTLRNSKLSGDKLQRRISLMKRSFKEDYDISMLDEIEEKFMSIISTGKEQFSEDDIDIIIRQVLGLEIREYDKSHLVNLELREIESVNPQPEKTPKSYIYGDTTITKIGTLTYTDSFGVHDLPGLPYYKIERANQKGEVITYKVFSHIDIGLMDDDADYRAAVLETLLDENNITKTNCGGYIGSIQTVQEGKGLEDTVKANSRYSLVFDSTDATAVVMLRNSVKQKYEQEKESGLEH